MGVHGLTTYLRDNRAALIRALEFTRRWHGCQDDKPHAIVVVDGWSFIFELMHCADLPWVYGGEYDVFAELVTQVVAAWIAVGMQLHFVFDGPYPSLKFPTLVSRITEKNIKGGLLFFRTSASARATPRFLHETSMMPPFAYSVCVQTLLLYASSSSPASPGTTGQLQVHFADEEGDPFAVALAGRLHAYVAGRDSDFVVLNTEGYKGYIPLDEMVWSAISSSSVLSETSSAYSSAIGDDDAEVDDSGFKIVRNSKTRKRSAANQRVGRGLIPPDNSTDSDIELSLTVTVYTPESLATKLQLPVTLLPLLGALVGNDYTRAPDDASPSSAQRGGPRSSNLQHLFFDRKLTVVQRIERVASILRSILPSTFISSGTSVHKRKQKKQIGSVLELIDAAVSALLIRSADSMAIGEREAIVDRIVEATLQYAISQQDDSVHREASILEERSRGFKWISYVCPLHSRETCSLFASLYRSLIGDEYRERLEEANESISDAEPSGLNEDGDSLLHLCDRYVTAYRCGDLNPRVLDAFTSGTNWPRIFLEDPDKESVSRSIGRPIRELYYSMLGAGIGLSQPVDSENETDSDDELIDVIEEEDEDPLAPLRGALEQLGEGRKENDDGSDLGRTPSHATGKGLQPRVVTEYVRRGTHLSAEEVLVRPLPDVMDALSVSIPEDNRISSFPVQLWPEDTRRTVLLRALQSDVPSVRALRADQLIAVLSVRWVVLCMNVRARDSIGNKEREKERWAREEARAFLAAFAWPESDRTQAHQLSEEAPIAEPIAVIERNIQLMAQLATALDTIEQFAQILLLADSVPSPMSWFSGRRLHANLTRGMDTSQNIIDPGLWQACIEGLQDAFADKLVKPKRERRRAEKGGPEAASSPAAHIRVTKRTGGMYDLLAQSDI